jgi:hypothetical protein
MFRAKLLKEILLMLSLPGMISEFAADEDAAASP